jgi:hypothetical protein
MVHECLYDGTAYLGFPSNGRNAGRADPRTQRLVRFAGIAIDHLKRIHSPHLHAPRRSLRVWIDVFGRGLDEDPDAPLFAMTLYLVERRSSSSLFLEARNNASPGFSRPATSTSGSMY